MNGDWGTYRGRLDPKEGTDTKGRDGFYMHGGNFPGSGGCIDLGDKDKELLKDLQDHDGDVDVFVDYPGTCPNKQGGQEGNNQ